MQEEELDLRNSFVYLNFKSSFYKDKLVLMNLVSRKAGENGGRVRRRTIGQVYMLAIRLFKQKAPASA